MDQPLGRAVGNALEVAESVACLRGEGSADLMEVTRALAREMLILGKVAADQGSADSLLNDRLESRTALEKFKEIAAAQGGDAMALEDLSRLPGAESVVDVFLEEERGGSGSEVKTFVASVDAAKIANAARMLGAGRSRMDQSVDHAVGVSDLVKVGEPLVSGQPVCRLHLNDPRNQSEAEALIREAIDTAPEPPPERPLVFDRLTSA
jgi:thymidine phosphorylase